MDNVKNDTYFANKIRDDLIFIVNYTKNIDEEELSNNEILLDSMMFRLIQISENAKRLSDEYKESHLSVPWTASNPIKEIAEEEPFDLQMICPMKD